MKKIIWATVFMLITSFNSPKKYWQAVACFISKNQYTRLVQVVIIEAGSQNEAKGKFNSYNKKDKRLFGMTVSAYEVWQIEEKDFIK